jgi:hypothetical protein
MTTAYLAAPEFEERLDAELAHAGVVVNLVHGRLRASEAPPVKAAIAADS